jgi:chaperonin GroES
MKLRLLKDNVLIKPIAKEEVTSTGIVLPDTVNQERPEQGIIIAVGPGRMLDNGQTVYPSVAAGDKVMFKKYSPDEIKIDGVEYLLISESDIVGILD